MGIGHCPVAYRKIASPNGGGKCNIDFAKEAFDTICKQDNCVAIALDIKSFFESLDHDRIKEVWCRLLEVERLPPDHFAVFKNITRYHVVDQKDAYRRLGFIEEITQANGQTRDRYTIPRRKMPTQLCTPAEFREKICGGLPNLPSLVKPNADESGNLRNHGIPQGVPISDLIANFYLLDFDCEMERYVSQKGGTYLRYSDDILLIVPSNEAQAFEAEKHVAECMKKCGPAMKINEKKTSMVQFSRRGKNLAFNHLRGTQGKNGFEYLGFRFDGNQIYVRDSTISRFYRKVTLAAKAVTREFADAHPEKDASELLSIFNYSGFSQRFSRVCFDKFLVDDYRTWTFFSYVKRAHKIFGEQRGAPIIPQVRNFKKIMRERIADSMKRAVKRRDHLAK